MGHQRALAAQRLHPDRVPDMAGHQAKIGQRYRQCLGHQLIGLGRGLETVGRLDAEAGLEILRQARAVQRGHSPRGRRVGQCHQTEPPVPQMDQRRLGIGMGGQRAHRPAQRILMPLGDRHAPDLPDHAQHRNGQGAEIAAQSGDRQGLGIEDQLREPVAHDGPVAEDVVEQRTQVVQVQQCLVDVKDQDGAQGHGGDPDRLTIMQNHRSRLSFLATALRRSSGRCRLDAPADHHRRRQPMQPFRW